MAFSQLNPEATATAWHAAIKKPTAKDILPSAAGAF
jgi:hypothetical protein